MVPGTFFEKGARHLFPRGLFVTGTDTGVGKTLVTAGLAAWCRAHGLDVGVMKPIATGGVRREGRWVSSDALLLMRAAGTADPLSLVNPVCYREPLAPYAAALRSRRPVDWPRAVRAFEALAARHPFVLVEGIGGLLVPLTRRKTVVDLIHALQLPVVVVSRLRLGTLNHTLLTVEHARHSGLRVLGVILNAVETPASGDGARLAERTNPDILRTYLPVPVLGTLPHRPDLANGAAPPRELADWVSRLDTHFLNWLLGAGPAAARSRRPSSSGAQRGGLAGGRRVSLRVTRPQPLHSHDMQV